MINYNELRDGQAFYSNGYKKGYEDAKKEYERPQTITCFNCKYDYKDATDEPCEQCEKHCNWQAKVEEA